MCIVAAFQATFAPAFADNVTDYASTASAVKRAVYTTTGIDAFNVQVATSTDTQLCGVDLYGPSAVGTAALLTQSVQTTSGKIAKSRQRGAEKEGGSSSTHTPLKAYNYLSSKHLEADEGKTRTIHFSVQNNVEGTLDNQYDSMAALETSLTMLVNASMESGEFGKYVVYNAKVYGATQMLAGPGTDSLSDLRTASFTVAPHVLLNAPTSRPTSSAPTSRPTCKPHTSKPTVLGETNKPTRAPIMALPTSQPTGVPSYKPISMPTGQPTSQPSTPTSQPSSGPTFIGLVPADPRGLNVLLALGVCAGLLIMACIGGCCMLRSYYKERKKTKKVFVSPMYASGPLNLLGDDEGIYPGYPEEDYHFPPPPITPNKGIALPKAIKSPANVSASEYYKALELVQRFDESSVRGGYEVESKLSTPSSSPAKNKKSKRDKGAVDESSSEYASSRDVSPIKGMKAKEKEKVKEKEKEKEKVKKRPLSPTPSSPPTSPLPTTTAGIMSTIYMSQEPVSLQDTPITTPLKIGEGVGVGVGVEDGGESGKGDGSSKAEAVVIDEYQALADEEERRYNLLSHDEKLALWKRAEWRRKFNSNRRR